MRNPGWLLAVGFDAPTRQGRIQSGSKGSHIYLEDGCIEIPPAKPREALDPTGCGDAYRAGLLYGLMEDLDWETTGRIASLMGAMKVEKEGTQNHSFTMAEFRQRFVDSFSYQF